MPADTELIKQMTKLHQFGIMSAPTTSQYAAIEALRNGETTVQEMREAYNGRRRYLMHAFREMGLECFEPFGAFYVFPSIKEFGLTSDEFAERLLREEHVIQVLPSANAAKDLSVSRMLTLWRILNWQCHIFSDLLRNYAAKNNNSFP